MFETTRFESERRLASALVLSLGLAGFAAMIVLIAPGILGEVDLAALFEQLPPAVVEEFGLEHMGTIEGFLAIELYEYIWLLGLGAWLAYTAAGTIAGDVETNRMDALLAAPVSRARLLVEKYLALLTPILLVNVVVFAVVYAGTVLIDEPIAVADLAAVHALSIPYFLACGAVGMLASVLAPRRRIAEGAAAGAIVAAFLLESVVAGTDLAVLGRLAPMRYYDPLAILTAGEYDLAGAAILSAGAGLLLAASAWLFGEVDVR